MTSLIPMWFYMAFMGYIRWRWNSFPSEENVRWLKHLAWSASRNSFRIFLAENSSKSIWRLKIEQELGDLNSQGKWFDKWGANQANWMLELLPGSLKILRGSLRRADLYGSSLFDAKSYLSGSRLVEWSMIWIRSVRLILAARRIPERSRDWFVSVLRSESILFDGSPVVAPRNSNHSYWQLRGRERDRERDRQTDIEKIRFGFRLNFATPSSNSDLLAPRLLGWEAWKLESSKGNEKASKALFQAFCWQFWERKTWN